MNIMIDDLLLHSDERLSNINVCNDLWLNSIDDIIKYCETNPNAHAGQFVGVSTNWYKKIYILVQSNIYNITGIRYYPICINDLYISGAFSYGGTYEVTSRISNISGALSISLNNISDVTYYKVILNNTCISDKFYKLDELFITAPILFSNDNDIKIELYNEEQSLVTTLRCINSVKTNTICSGILTPIM